jgi:hypothetical protein
MKLKEWAGLTLMLVILTGLVFAETQQENRGNAESRQRMRRSTAAARERMTAGRERLYQQRLAQQADAHAAEIKELLDIKKLAEEENATKTAEAIQALIDKKNNEYKQQVEQVERARRERAERLERMRQQAEERQQGAAAQTQQGGQDNQGTADEGGND